MIDRGEFTKGMAYLMAAYPDYPCSDATVAVYWENLKDLTFKEFEVAVKSHVRKNRWFPKVNELRADRDRPKLAAEVWNELILANQQGKSPKLDWATERALMGAVGGWGGFQLMTFNDMPYRFKTFERIYNDLSAKKGYQIALAGETQAQITGGE